MPPRQEQLLINLLDQAGGGRMLCTTVGRGELATAAAQAAHVDGVTCWLLDLYHLRQLQRTQASSSSGLSSQVELICSADFPEAALDAALLPLSSHGEAELARDLMQAAHHRLVLGGRLITATDNPRDRWLGEQMQKLCARVQRYESGGAAAYLGIKEAPLPKLKHFDAAFAFRDQGCLWKAYSRPGVFAHRRVDPGARHLLNSLEDLRAERIVDLGCGSGVVAIGLAGRSPDVQVSAIDANARAVECTRKGAAANGLKNIVAKLCISDELYLPERQHIVLANPPYYSDFRIARSFLEAAHRVLESGGRILFVTKSPDWYHEHLPEFFNLVQCDAVKGYYVVQGVKG